MMPSVRTSWQRRLRPGRAVALPPALRVTLLELFGPAVDGVRVIEHSWLAWLHPRALATTRRRRVYLRHGAAPFFADPALVLHEFFHVLGQWEPRRLSVWKYLIELFRRGYWDNRFEIEAREFADDHRHRYCALLARHEAAAEMRDARDSRDARGSREERGPRHA